MWIFQNNSFLSVVAHKHLPDQLLVRSRVKGDIERAIPSAKVFEDREADYRYRAIVTRAQLKQALLKAVDRIDYPNFKDSIPKNDHQRKSAYMSVWQAMASVFGAFGLSHFGRSSRDLQPVDLFDLGLPDDPDIDQFVNG